jgi:hypothetical protein
VYVSAGSTKQVSESGTSSSFEVVLATQPSDDVTINVSTSDNTEGTITAPFAADSGILTFTSGNWSVPQTVTVTGIDDAGADGNQAFMIVLGVTASLDAGYNGTIDPVDVNYTNVDDDGSADVYVNAGSTMLVSESGTTSSFEVVLGTQPTNDVTINVSTGDNTEGTIVAPFVADSGILTFTSGNWSIPQTVTVMGLDDLTADGNQPFTIVLGVTGSLDVDYNGTIDPVDVSYTCVDNGGIPGVTVSAGSLMQVSESGTSSSFEIVLNTQPTSDVTITVQTSDATEGTITAPFVADSGFITFTNGNWDIPKTITVAGVDDLAGDGDQGFMIELWATSSLDPTYNGTIDPADISFMNLDDDGVASVYVNAGTGMLVSESGAVSTFEVVLGTQPTDDVTINVSTSDNTEGTIVAPFAADSGILTFTSGNWNIAQGVTVSGVEDLMADGNQAFTIVLGVTASVDPDYNGTIDPVDVSFTCVDNGGVPGVTVSAGSQKQVSEDGTSSSFEVVLNTLPTDDVTINVSTSDNTEGTIVAPFAADSGNLTFTVGNWFIAQTVTVTGVDDFSGDGNQAFVIVLGLTSSLDAAYNGTIDPVDVNFTNVDDDGVASVYVSAGSGMLVTEDGTGSSFEVVLGTQPTNDVTINVSTGDNTEGTITFPFAADSGDLTFTSGNWSIPQTVTVTGVDDFSADGNQPFMIVLGVTASVDPDYNGTIDPVDVTFTNVDDDGAASVFVNAGSAKLVSEGGTTSSFEVVLGTQPTNNVTINVSTGDNTEGTIAAPFAADSGDLTFTNGNWSVPQTVTVAGVDDVVADGNQAFMIVLGVTASVDPAYSGTIDPVDVNYTNIDDDVAAAGVLVLAGTNKLVSESGATSSFEVVLTSQPTNDVTINVSTSDNTEGTIVAPFAADSGPITFTNGNWDIPKTITVVGVDGRREPGVYDSARGDVIG